MHMAEAILAVLLIAYLLFHGHHYRAHRRNGCGVWYSMAGPFHTTLTVRKRVRLGHLVLGAVIAAAALFAAGAALGGIR